MPSYVQLELHPIQIRTANGFSCSWQRRYAASRRGAPRWAEPSRHASRAGQELNYLWNNSQRIMIITRLALRESPRVEQSIHGDKSCERK